MYDHMFRAEIDNSNIRLWKGRTPLKIKIFLWLIEQNVILTKDNLVKRKWQGDVRCCFCPENESINHLFFDCSMARYIWSLIALVVGLIVGRPHLISSY